MKIWLKKVITRKKHRSEPLITITLSKSALLHNLYEFQKISPENKIAPVLKSNAYGHGLLEIASILQNKADFFVIDSYFEAERLRNEGITTPLLIVGYVRPEQIRSSKLKNISYVIGSLDSLRSLNVRCRIHLKIDTGMHRQGILPEELSEAFDHIKRNKNIVIEGICSHLSDADNTNPTFTEKQIQIWNAIVKKSCSEFPSIKQIHISNTHGHRYSKKITANMSRLGIGLYGLAQIEGLNLKPVLEMKSIITGIKKIKKGERVGYGEAYTALNDMIIATIPIGYYEGLPLKLGNKGWVTIKDIETPIIGRVSMNITTIDVSSIPKIKIGDEVIVISSRKEDRNSIQNIARMCDTIAYEIAVKIEGQLKRIII